MSTIQYDDVGPDLRRILISGNLDATGAKAIAPQLLEFASGPKKAVVVDLCGVRFLASVGIGALIASAKAVKSRGGKMALVVDKRSTVMMSLEATGVDQLIPVFAGFSEAEKAALA